MIASLPDAIELSRYAELAHRERLLPVQVTPHYLELVKEELSVLKSRNGPLYRVVFPTDERTTLRVPHEVVDFVEDRQNMPPGLYNSVIRKYRNRLLFLITERCAAHCMYCFRQDVLSEPATPGRPNIEERVASLIRYLQAHAEVEEVILSGGDPLSVPADWLELVLRRVREETNARHLRVHTRNVVFAPHLVSDQKCAVLGRWQTRVVIHAVHPYELDPEAERSIDRLRSQGVRCYAQFPVLRGINDHPVVLERLLAQFDDIGVRPLTMFVPDPINYSACFRIGLSRLFGIVDQLNELTSSWVNAVRLVLDTPFGKVRRENIVAWDHCANVVTFQRGQNRVRYHDFPAELDTPGDLATLLWKG